MRKFILFLLLIISIIDSNGQTKIDYKPYLGNYFSSKDPFGQNPDILLNSFLHDADLRIDSLVLPTDTSLLYLRGYYKKFNPFGEKVNLVQVYYFQSVWPMGKAGNKDTMLSYHILGVTGTGDSGIANAAAAEIAVFKKLQHHFPEITKNRSTNKSDHFYAAHFYHIGVYPIAFSMANIWPLDKTNFCVAVHVDFGFVERADRLIKTSTFLNSK